MKWILLLSVLIAWLATIVVNAQVSNEVSCQAESPAFVLSGPTVGYDVTR